MKMNAGESERGGNRGCCRLPVGTKSLAILIELRVVLARTPALQHFFDGRPIDAKELLIKRQVGSEGDDRADIEIPIRPAVETSADAFHQRVVNRRMTN